MMTIPNGSAATNVMMSDTRYFGNSENNENVIVGNDASAASQYQNNVFPDGNCNGNHSSVDETDKNNQNNNSYSRSGDHNFQTQTNGYSSAQPTPFHVDNKFPATVSRDKSLLTDQGGRVVGRATPMDTPSAHMSCISGWSSFSSDGNSNTPSGCLTANARPLLPSSHKKPFDQSWAQIGTDHLNRPRENTTNPSDIEHSVVIPLGSESDQHQRLAPLKLFDQNHLHEIKRRTMKIERRRKTFCGAIHGVAFGGLILGPPGAVIGGVVGGVAARSICKAGERRVKRRHEKKMFRQAAAQSKVARGAGESCVFV